MIYGFTGKMCTGKDTFFSYLVEKKLLESKQYAFADKVKEIAVELFKVDVVHKDDRGRRVLQQVGQKMREIETECWINYVFDQIKKQKGYEKKNYGITDVRHTNEADAIINRGGHLIYLACTDQMRKDRLYIRDKIRVDDDTWAKWASHPSEYEVDQIFEKYKDHAAILILDQKTNDFNENYSKLMTGLKAKNWI